MARVRGTFNIAANYDSSVKRPFDARMLVPTYADLTISDNWYLKDLETGELTTTLIAYNGMIVVVADKTDIENSGLYILMDYNAKKNPDVTIQENWIKIGEADLTVIEERLTALEALPDGVTTEQVAEQINALKAEIMSLEYLTKTDLEGYATTDVLSGGLTETLAEAKAYADSLVAGVLTEDSLAAKLAEYVTSDAFAFYQVSVNDQFAAITEQIESINTELGQKASVSDVANLTAQVADLTDGLESKVDSSTLDSYYTASEIDDKDFAPKSYVDDKVAEAVSGGQIDLSGYAKTEQVNAVSREVGQLGADIAEVSSNLDEVSETLQTGINEVRADVGAMSTNVDELSDRVTALEDVQIMLIHGGSAPVTE